MQPGDLHSAKLLGVWYWCRGFHRGHALKNCGVRLKDHIDRHKINPSSFEAWGLRFREVVVDMRAIRARRLCEYTFEFTPDNPLVPCLKLICREAAELMHVEYLGFLRAERECRSLIASAVLS